MIRDLSWERFRSERPWLVSDPTPVLPWIPWTRSRGCGLARALALSGEVAKAKSAYNDLFSLWTNTDPGIPVLQEARAEYARLQ